MIYSDNSILAAFDCGYDLIVPFNKEQLNPGSYDVTLAADEYIQLVPGQFLLVSTVEAVNIPLHTTAFVHGKSSLGRQGLQVHFSGLLDAGFRGNITLQLFNASRETILLAPGMRIAQVTFHRMDGVASSAYDGRYQDSVGVTSAK